nr:signal peptidase II [uncultured Sellimonas sp.]
MKKEITGLGAALLGIDLFCKSKTEKKPEDTEERAILNGKVLIRKVRNDGMAFNLFAGNEKIVKGCSVMAAAIILTYHIRLLFSKKRNVSFLGTTLILSGACSNLYDRFRKGYVTDYIGFETENKAFREITFNIGDFCLAAGALILSAVSSVKLIKDSVKGCIKRKKA